MTNVIIKAITLGISLLTSAIISGCTVGNENIVTNVDSSITTTTTHNIEAVTTTTTTSEVTTTTTTAKPETTTTTTTPATTTVATTPAPATTTTAATTTQAPVVTTTTTTVTTKPVETTAPAYDCKRDGHKFVMTTITSEPMWCEEVHDVLDCGYDATAAARFLGVANEGEACQIFYAEMDKLGLNGHFAGTDMKVKVWGTKTYEAEVCTICGDTGSVGITDATINPLGDWQYKNGNPRINDPRLDFNTLFYNPYNVPQSVLDSIELYELIMLGWA